MEEKDKNLRIAFVVDLFPAISETWLINQIADLNDQGIDIEIFSFRKGSKENISQRFFDYKMEERTHYLDMPRNPLVRFLLVLPKVFNLLFFRPSALFGALNFKKYGRNAFSLKLIYWAEPFLGRKFDLYHCYYGTIANKFLIIKDIIGINKKIITSLLGYDISSLIKQKGVQVYDRLKKESAAFIVMSNNMKARVIGQGFAEEKIHVLPISIDVNAYPFKERHFKPGETIQIATVGRFVEKKGFDDILRALAIVKNKTDKKFMCNIIGGGPLESRLRTMAKEFDLDDVVSFKGYMKIEEIINYFLNMHFYLQPSKTASDGDME